MLILIILVFIIDTGKECFVWVGKKASVDERRKGLEYAHVSIYIISVQPCNWVKYQPQNLQIYLN